MSCVPARPDQHCASRGALFGADFAKLEHDTPELHARIRQVMSERRVVET